MLTEMVLIDFETNGVPQEVDQVIPFEVGLAAADRAGNIIGTFESLILVPGWEKHLSEASHFVKEMHRKSGLAADLQRAHMIPGSYRKFSLESVQDQILEWLELMPRPSGEKLPMTGSTVHFDRAVAIEHMPLLNGWFHYRNQDISSLKNFCKLNSPELYRLLPQDEQKLHRPLADIRSSLREYQWYRANFLRIEEGGRTW